MGEGGVQEFNTTSQMEPGRSQGRNTAGGRYWRDLNTEQKNVDFVL